MNNTKIISSYAFYGGVIYIQDFSVLYFNDCEISESQTSGTLIDMDNSYFSMKNNTISKAYNNLFLVTSSTILIDGIIISNHRCNTRIQGCLLTAQSDSNLQISNATIFNINSVISNNIYLESSNAFLNQIFFNNTMNEQKGGGCLGSKESKIDINGSSFHNYFGNCLNIQSSMIVLNNSIFNSNKYNFGNIVFELGAFYCLDCQSYVIENSIFSLNQKVMRGPAIQCINIYKKDENASISKILRSFFRENEGIELGGAIYLHNQQVEVEKCNFKKNSANEGGGIYCSIDGKLIK